MADNIKDNHKTQSSLPHREGWGGSLIDIKKELRANMNGVASAAMRQTADYRVNWGIEVPRIHAIAEEFRNEASHELAQTLWNESVRECKILATLLMPVDRFDEELCDVWVDNIRTEEIAQMFCLNLMTRLPFASVKAFEWISSSADAEGEEVVQSSQKENCGYLTLCHLMRKNELSERSTDEFLDQASTALNNKYAIRALQIFGSKSEDNARRVKNIADYLV